MRDVDYVIMAKKFLIMARNKQFHLNIELSLLEIASFHKHRLFHL